MKSDIIRHRHKQRFIKIMNRVRFKNDTWTNIYYKDRVFNAINGDMHLVSIDGITWVDFCDKMKILCINGSLKNEYYGYFLSTIPKIKQSLGLVS